MEKNYISEYEQTHFYISLINKTYGVCITIIDLERADEIIQHFRETEKECIEAWKQEWKEGVC